MVREQLRWCTFETPLGEMLAVACDRGLVLCEFLDRPALEAQLKRAESACDGAASRGHHDVLDRTKRELREYFDGKRREFTIPLVLDGSEFQTAVWRELLHIPFGTTTSYDAIAKRVKRPRAARAVGGANNRNRIPIIVPCHRVIAASGALSGYGGGTHRKQRLLELEQRASL